MTEAKIEKPRKKTKKVVTQGRIYIQSSFNNTIITVTDTAGNVLFSGSAGSCGFKGTKKSTPYAAAIVAKKVGEAAKEAGLSKVDILVKGVGTGREAAIRALIGLNFDVQTIKDITPIPHNGCRPKKPRRV
jgi:small subunit ribosomal protein S11